MKDAKLIESIEEGLSYIKNQVITKNKNGRLDINKYAEGFFIPILNKIYRTKFERLEFSLGGRDTPGIDLGSRSEKIAIQVTSTNTYTKVKHTITQFLKPKHDYLASYDKLYILFIGEEYNTSKSDADLLEECKKHNPNIPSDFFTKKSLINISTLVAKIESEFAFKRSEELSEVASFLNGQLITFLPEDRYIDSYLIDIATSINKKSIAEDNPLSAFSYVMQRFEGLCVFPPYILTKIYPFSKVEKSSRISSFSLHTNNEDFYHLCDEIINKKTKLSKEEEQLIHVLKFNIIYHVYGHSETISQKICVHTYLQKNVCTCEKCTLKVMEFDNLLSNEKLNTGTVENYYEQYDNAFDLLKIPYVKYKIGSYADAIQDYFILINKFEKDKKYLAYFLCHYNLKNLARFFEGVIEKSEQKKIDEINLNKIVLKLKSETSIPREILSIIQWIKEAEFIRSGSISITTQVQQIAKLHYSDQHGGVSTHNKVHELLQEVATFENFIQGNSIIHDGFYSFGLVINQAIEGFIMLYSFKNSKTPKLDFFKGYIIELMMLYGEYDRMLFLFKKYYIKHLECSEDECLHILTLIKNLYQSEKFIQALGRRENSYHTNSNYFNILKNSILILSKLKLEDKFVNEYFSYLFDIIRDSMRDFYLVQELVQFIRGQGERLSIQNLERLLEFHFNSAYQSNVEVLSLVVYYIKETEEEYSINNENILNYIEENLIINDLYSEDVLLELYIIQEIYPDKNVIKNYIEHLLDQNCSYRVFQIAEERGLISHEKIIRILKEKIPQKWTSGLFFSEVRDKNNTLNYFIELAYKYSISLSSPEYQKLNKDIPYYKWLMNLESFDYAEFKPYWLLKYKSKIYFAEFKKQNKLKLRVKEYLKDNYLEGLAKIFIEHLTD